ncbi:MAG: DNA topoisomerase 4 subunit A, partial [Halobacteriovoraceae bacterium]|nr:DNA topoisomerase 4 subunit A [Halobacteriovoraceae bacterium]
MEDLNGNIEPVLLQKEMKDCYLDYAMSVIIGRALPDARDGMKPVHRRILYAMHTLNNTSARPYLKSARVVGDVIGKYHPHGESAVYNSIVRMAQDFSLRYMLVDGQGNFGSIDGDEAAAMRYTEIRMEKISEDILQDIGKETVDWAPNYDDSLKEPKVLPTRIPNLLINGSTGIAVGMATNIPPHNLKEVAEGLRALLDDPKISIEDLIKIIPGPDFPTAGAIYGTYGIIQAYHTGRGVIQVRAKYEIESYGKDRERIVVKELPYQVNKAKVIERIAELVNAKTITGISDIRDESNRLGIRICIDLKRGEIANIIINQLLKTTSLQSSFGIIFLSIHNGAPKVMNIKDQLQCFLDHRHEIIVRRTVFDLSKARAKAHILEGLKIAVENMDAAISLIKKSEGPSKAKKELITAFKLSEKQAQAILDMRLQRLTGLERDKIITDYEQTVDIIKELETILNDDYKVKEIIRDELKEVSEKYGDERRTEIIAKEDEINIEDLIKKEEQIVTITHKGYIKRMALNTYRTQKRGGSGVKGALRADDDFYTSIF